MSPERFSNAFVIICSQLCLFRSLTTGAGISADLTFLSDCLERHTLKHGATETERITISMMHVPYGHKEFTKQTYCGNNELLSACCMLLKCCPAIVLSCTDMFVLQYDDRVIMH